MYGKPKIETSKHALDYLASEFTHVKCQNLQQLFF